MSDLDSPGPAGPDRRWKCAIEEVMGQEFNTPREMMTAISNLKNKAPTIDRVKHLIQHVMLDVGITYKLGRSAESETIKVCMNQRIKAHEHTLRMISELWPETLEKVEIQIKEAPND